ncbi:hypothetical protein [Lysobacter enzymogenes]|uniref:hypothetical protein n=1 Tax=Lysobacter enzymogenes TaxID=69 RepID=UPI001A973DB1|nr:hypothetical protein [Lysobacter enzymogenes]QQP96728.1 hypothetical protein JHW38_01340 [Lysobacter enzymogenes]
MTEGIEQAHVEFLSRTMLIRRWLILQGEGEVEGFSPEMAANVRGWAIVWMGAAAESFWKPFLHATCKAFAQSSVMAHRRNARAQSIFFLERMFCDVTKELNPRWERSFALIESMVSADRKDMSFSLPYDGKTLRPRHIELFWNLFRIDGSPFPSIIHKQSLETLADDRNTVAHGEQLPNTVGRLRSKRDVMSTLTRLEETLEKTYLATLDVLR